MADGLYWTTFAIATPSIFAAVIDVLAIDVLEDDLPFQDLLQFSDVIDCDALLG